MTPEVLAKLIADLKNDLAVIRSSQRFHEQRRQELEDEEKQVVKAIEDIEKIKREMTEGDV